MLVGFGFLLMLGFAFLFYKAAELEDLSMPVAWGGGSVLVYLGAIYGLHWGLCSALFLQVLLFLGMGAWLALRKHWPGGWLGRRKARKYRREGRCLQCGYDLTGTPRPGHCPECGMELPGKGS